MPAIPRKWQYSLIAAAGNSLITLEGIDGVAHVLTHAEFKGYNQNTAQAYSGEVQLTSSGLPMQGLCRWSVSIAADANHLETDDASWDGEIIIPAGDFMTVSLFPDLFALMAGTLLIQGYDQ